MWVKMGNQYYQDLRLYNIEFALECNDLDGCAFRIRTIKGWKRKINRLIKVYALPIKLSGDEPIAVRAIMRKRSRSEKGTDYWMELTDCLDTRVSWVDGVDFSISQGLVLDYKNIVNDKPPHGVVINSLHKTQDL